MSISNNPSVLVLNGIVYRPDQIGIPDREMLFQHFTDTGKVIMPYCHSEHGPFTCEFVLTFDPTFVLPGEKVGIQHVCSLGLSVEDDEWLALCAESFYWGWSNWSGRQQPLRATFWINTFDSNGPVLDFIKDLMQPRSDFELVEVGIADFESADEDGANTSTFPHIHCAVTASSRDALIETRTQLTRNHPEVCFSLSFLQPWRQV
jgi:hypothetical protein